MHLLHILGTEVGGRLVEGEREHPFGVSGSERERARSAPRMSIEMERPKPVLVRGLSDAVDLRVERVGGRRHGRTSVHLELLGHRVHFVAQRLEQASKPKRRWGDDARKEDHRVTLKARTHHDPHHILSHRISREGVVRGGRGEQSARPAVLRGGLE